MDLGRPWVFRGLVIALAIVVGAAALLTVRTLGSDSPRTLGEAEVKLLLRELPYKFEFESVDVPEGADGAVGGTVTGGQGVKFRFGIDLGSGFHPVRLSGVRTQGTIGSRTFGMVTDIYRTVGGKMHYNKSIRTNARFNEAIDMVAEIEYTLCMESEGTPCPI